MSRSRAKSESCTRSDVVGSTEVASRSDPEVMRGVMVRFYAAIREPVERHGGTVEKVIGDALVAVFGIPVVHEDDALRAVRAALEMRDAVRELGEIQARIGVNTGDVLARDATPGESLVVGDAVNVAARLEQGPARARCSWARRPGRWSPTVPAASSSRRWRPRGSASRSWPGGWSTSTPPPAATAAASISPWSAATPSSSCRAGRSIAPSGWSAPTS
jgi:Adenylate and Guanylate cyclase catalytic domain